MVLGIASDIICAAHAKNATHIFACSANAGSTLPQSIARKVVGT